MWEEPEYSETRNRKSEVRSLKSASFDRRGRLPTSDFLLQTSYFRCFPTSFVISNILTCALPPKIGFSVSSDLIIRLFF